jgi:hypothetical protein
VEALNAVASSFKGNLLEDWLNESSKYEKENGVAWVTQGYPTLVKWITIQLSIEVRDEELESQACHA